MISFAYSLAAHEKPTVLIDQIQNINRFNKNYSILIILHLSKIFELTEDELNDISSQPNVLLNPERLITGYMDGSLYEAHLSNINFFYTKEIEFGHIIFLASNMMFVRQMIKLHSDFIGNSHDAILHKGWFQAWMAVRDNNINKFHLYGCQIEGLFISKRLLDNMLAHLRSISYKKLFKSQTVIKRNAFLNKIIRQWRKFRFKKWVNTNYLLQPIQFFTLSQLPFAKIAYATEEVYFPTIAKLFQDQFIFKGSVLSYQNWEKSSIVTRDSIAWLRSSANNDYVCTKRIDRNYDDPIRVHIRELSDDI